jgi:hypothetical protein
MASRVFIVPGHLYQEDALHQLTGVFMALFPYVFCVFRNQMDERFGHGCVTKTKSSPQRIVFLGPIAKNSVLKVRWFET